MPTTQPFTITAAERLAIADTVARYCHAVDKHDKEEFVSVFAEDGYMGADMFGTYRGKNDTSTGLRACYDMLKSELFSDGGEQQHHVVNQILTKISPDRISMWAEWMFLVMYHGVPRPASFGEYEDVFVRVGDEWLIESRIVTCAQGRGPAPLNPLSPELNAASSGLDGVAGQENEFRELGVEPPRFLGLLAGIDPRFAASCLGFAARPGRPHVLEPKVEQFIRLAMNVSVTQLHTQGSRAAIRNALRAGATPREIVEVLELVSVLGIHTLSLATPILIEELRAAGIGVEDDLSPRQVALRERYIRERGVWSPPWDAMLILDPDFLEAYLEFSLGPFRDGGALEPKVKEFVWIAVDVSTSHLHPIGARGHIQGALKQGASQGEVVEVLQIVTSVGLHSLDLGLSLLAEEMAR